MTPAEEAAFREAIAGRGVDRLLQLVSAGADLSEVGPVLLKLAVDAELAHARRHGEEPHVDLTTLLLIGGADPRRQIDGGSALHAAASSGHWLAALTMDRWGRSPSADPGSSVSSPELVAAIDNAIELERFRKVYDLLAAGGDVHAEVSGRSLLMQAQALEIDAWVQDHEIHVDRSSLLLALGADPFRPPRGASGPTASQLADKYGYTPDVLLYESWTRSWESRG